MRTSYSAEELLRAAIAAIDGPPERVIDALDAVPAPVYVADAQGVITHFNRACIIFAGRVPDPGSDRWNPSWRMWTPSGEPLMPDQTPMAIAIREQRPIRDVEVIAERPDGTRIHCLPHPTPIFDLDGEFLGVINLILDVTATREAERLRSQAARCRWLVTTLSDESSIATLIAMAAEYEAAAARIEREGSPLGQESRHLRR